ncbi:MAG: hypothetical protein IT299_11915 [Dehalococcoidia bacterium]|nr:hypothetical protein [Dehalococcoidia bacterium]
MRPEPSARLLVVAVAILLVTGCADEDLRGTSSGRPASPPSTVATAALATPTVEGPRALPGLTKTKDGAVVTQTPSAMPLPPPRLPVSSGLWLARIDGPAPGIVKLHDIPELRGEQRTWIEGTFALDGSVWVKMLNGAPEHFAPDGSPLPTSALGADEAPRCEQPQYDVPRVTVGGRQYDANCGSISPDGRLMTWRSRAAPGAAPAAAPLDVYLLDLESGVSRQLPVTSRGGAGDSFWNDRWSPGAEFVLLIWFGDDEAYLADRAGNVRPAGRQRGLFALDRAMSWSPSELAYLSPGVDGVPFVEWPATGRRVFLPAASWPAHFDLSGRFVVWVDAGPQGPTTVVADTETGEVVARWTGTQAMRWKVPLSGVTSVEGRPAGLMELDLRSRESTGNPTPDSVWNTTTVVHHPLLAHPLELPKSGNAAWSSDGMRVACVRGELVERVIEATATTGRALMIDATWIVEVLDVRSGERREITRVRDSRGTPVLTWSPRGDALLITFPPPSGI